MIESKLQFYIIKTHCKIDKSILENSSDFFVGFLKMKH